MGRGHPQGGAIHPTPLHSGEQQIRQGGAHRRLLSRLQRQDQGKPQPVGHEAMAQPGQPRQPQQRAAPHQGFAIGIA